MTSNIQDLKELNNEIVDAINKSGADPEYVMILLMRISAEICSQSPNPQKSIIEYTNLARKIVKENI